MSARVVLLTIRDPDHETEHLTETEGDIEIKTVDIDLGSQFNGPKHLKEDLDDADQRDWLEQTRAQVSGLAAESPIRQRVEELCAELEEGEK
jgi:hypothetical protein